MPNVRCRNKRGCDALFVGCPTTDAPEPRAQSVVVRMSSWYSPPGPSSLPGGGGFPLGADPRGWGQVTSTSITARSALHA